MLPTRDTGTPTDAVTTDTASRPDAIADAATPRMDSAVQESGTTVDSGARADTGAPVDTGVRGDSGGAMDSGVPSDSGAATDSGVATDSGTSGADAAPPGDGGTGAGGYTATRFASGASCEAITGTVLADVSGDDSAMLAPEAMPFAFSYFGVAATHWSASTNGIAQLWPSASGRPSSVYSNVVIPDVSAPEGMVAAFWDDLVVDAPALVRAQTVGTAPARRHIIEWNGAQTIDLSADLRFQIKFFEGSNIIEFHYCTMTDLDMSDRYSGDSATIGIQDFTGSQATQVSSDTAGTTGTGVYIRFTPR